MHLIRCPNCGVRDEAEFTYRGDASVARPAADAGADAFYDYLHTRQNIRGWQLEWWHHVYGCRRFIKVARNTATHEIAATGRAGETLEVPRP
jgi:methylglutamate dehydrogenase subunit B